MAIPVSSLRSAAAKRRQASGYHPVNGCELCLKPLKIEAPLMANILVPIDHEKYEFVTKAEEAERGDTISYFPVGPDCFKKIQRALGEA